MVINFVTEFAAVMEYQRNQGLDLRERMLWLALLDIARRRAKWNKQEGTFSWESGFFPVQNAELNLSCGFDKRGIDAARNKLKQRGIIDYQNGERNKRAPAYRIFYLTGEVGYKNVPNIAPNIVPNNVPNTAPNIVPNNVPNVVPNIAPISNDILYYNTDLEEKKRDIRYTASAGTGARGELATNGAWRNSERARAAVAQRIIDRFSEIAGGDISRANLHGEICRLMSEGMPPEEIAEELEKRRSPAAAMQALNARIRRGEYDGQNRELYDKCLAVAQGNQKFADALYRMEQLPGVDDEED